MRRRGVSEENMTEELFYEKEIIELTAFPPNKCFERALEYGFRAWRVRGKRTLIVWDEGNGWYSILTQEYPSIYSANKRLLPIKL